MSGKEEEEEEGECTNPICCVSMEIQIRQTSERK